MRNLLKSKIALTTAVVVAVLALTPIAFFNTHVSAASTNSYTGGPITDCAKVKICADVIESDKILGTQAYVGHDEPALIFYSNTPGSGNRMQYQLTIPKDPPMDSAAGKSFNFQLHVAFWFGMAMCDTQSFPLLVKTCKPDSDDNIVDPAVSARHAGTAFMELQFYPPGWVKRPNFVSCDEHKWCAALTIDSVSANAITGQSLNPTCAARTGVEYVNFAFITKSGKPQPNSPPNPVHANINTATPNPTTTLFMNAGDTININLHDTEHGLQTVLNDLTTHQSGSMTASAQNGFGQVKFAPAPSTECKNIPYDFHPMYSTSSEKTRVPWAVHSYNVAFSDEVGHFDACTGPNKITLNGSCPQGNTEGDGEATDGDDNFCFPASASSEVHVSGCTDSNTGFDGASYQKIWPDGKRTHPTPIIFTSPLTGKDFNVNYSRVAFEADLPNLEGTCNQNTGAGCTLIPTTDDGAPANFYPFYTAGEVNGDQCIWTFGNDIPGITENDFGKNAQYGAIFPLAFTNVGGGSGLFFEDFRQILNHNPCPA